jgi:hypothetical protein
VLNIVGKKKQIPPKNILKKLKNISLRNPQGEVGVAEGERLARLRRELLSACQRDQLLPSSQRDQLLPTLDQREGTATAAAVKSGSSSCQLSITVSNCYPRLRYRIKAGRLYFHRKGLFISNLFFLSFS